MLKKNDGFNETKINFKSFNGMNAQFMI